MTEVVKAYVWQCSSLKQKLKVPLGEVLGVDRCACPSSEDQAVVLVQTGKLHPCPSFCSTYSSFVGSFGPVSMTWTSLLPRSMSCREDTPPST
jgi:hypothetical protein